MTTLWLWGFWGSLIPGSSAPLTSHGSQPWQNLSSRTHKYLDLAVVPGYCLVEQPIAASQGMKNQESPTIGWELGSRMLNIRKIKSLLNFQMWHELTSLNPEVKILSILQKKYLSEQGKAWGASKPTRWINPLKVVCSNFMCNLFGFVWKAPWFTEDQLHRRWRWGKHFERRVTHKKHTYLNTKTMCLLLCGIRKLPSKKGSTHAWRSLMSCHLHTSNTFIKSIHQIHIHTVHSDLRESHALAS